jgi:phosphomannomutase
MPNLVNYVFDIDGTLTPARLPIDLEFEAYFLEWIQGKKVYLISGSDYAKSLEQVGETILHAVAASFNTAGNICYKKGKEIYRNEWTAPSELVSLLEMYMKESTFPVRAGRHFEHRIGMLNFSIVGRDCTREQRKAYNEFDNEVHERKRFCSEIMEKFPEIEATVGGQISIDIYALGSNKAQIIEHLDGNIHFFGDKTKKGENDYAIASKLLTPPNLVSTVRDWKHTWALLKEIG